MNETFSHQITENVIISPKERTCKDVYDISKDKIFVLNQVLQPNSIVNHIISFKGRKQKSLKVPTKKKWAVVARMQS